MSGLPAAASGSLVIHAAGNEDNGKKCQAADVGERKHITS